MTEPEGLWSALMRRKVVRTIAVYLAVGWVAIQAASLIASIWSLPNGVVQGVFVLLVIGLPVTAMLSWVYDFRDAGVIETRGAGFAALVRVKFQRDPKRTGAALAGFAFALLLGIAYAWPDEALSDDAERIRATVQQRDDDPHNLVYGLFGFAAPADADFWAYGRARVVMARTLGDESLLAQEPTGYTIENRHLCALLRRRPTCAAEIEQSLSGVPELLAANAVPLARYRALHDARSFGDPFGAAAGSLALTPPWVPVMFVGHKLELRRAWLADASGDHALAQRILGDEDLFYRRMLAQSSNILVKMLAVSRLLETTRARAAIAERAAARPGHSGFPAAPPARLTLAERAFVEPLTSEAASFVLALTAENSRTAIGGLFNDGDSATTLARLLPFRPKATANRLVAGQLSLARASLLSAAELARTPVVTLVPYGPLEIFTNGAGLLSNAVNDDYASYLDRVHDLDALVALAQVAHHLHAKGVASADVPGALLALPPALRDPKNGNPPTYAEGALKFEREPVQGRESEAWLLFTPSG